MHPSRILNRIRNSDRAEVVILMSGKSLSILLLSTILAAVPVLADKLTFDERVEITRGLTAEYATAKVAIPRSKKALKFNVNNGTWDKAQWDDAQREFGPAARKGDLVQVSKITIDDDKLVLELNGGMKSGRKWYDRIEVGMGSRTSPIGQGQTNAPGGTTIVMLFDKPLEPMKAGEVKKLLLPLLDFEKRTATEAYVDTLPPEIKKAIDEKKPIEGMDREQVLLALGAPRTKVRETKDGDDYEDWIYGQPPGKITFVTFKGQKVHKVRDIYGGLGGEVVPKQVPPN